MKTRLIREMESIKKGFLADIHEIETLIKLYKECSAQQEPIVRKMINQEIAKFD